jgi:hypothetical protein
VAAFCLAPHLIEEQQCNAWDRPSLARRQRKPPKTFLFGNSLRFGELGCTTTKREDGMAEDETRSLHQIKRETEEARADLTNTVDQLRSTVTETATEIKDRLRPDAIKAEVSSYIKSRGEQLLSDVTEAARRNPLQAVAVGACMSYPLLRLARAIPVPILMIGAGLFFAGSKTGRDLTQQASDAASELADKARQRGQDLGDQISRTAADAKDYASSRLHRAADAVAEGREAIRRRGEDATGSSRDGFTLQNVRDAANATVAGVSDLKDRAAGLAGDASSSIQQKLSEATSSVRQTAADTKHAGQEFMNNARDRVSDVGQQTTQTVRDVIEQNPLLVAGAGLLLGGLIASALPKLQAEDTLLGDASTAVKKRAQEAAARGFESARGAAGEIISTASQQAQVEGLTSDALACGAQDVRQRLQRVAERAVTTAFDPDTEHHAQGSGERHG